MLSIPTSMKKTLLAILFVSASLQCVSISASKIVDGSKETFKIAKDAFFNLTTPAKLLVIAVTLGGIQYRCSEPSNKPARTSWKEIGELISNPKKFAISLKNDPKGTMAKFWYMTADLIIGRAGEFAYLKGNLKDGSVSLKKSCPAMGFFGKLHSYCEPMELAILYSTVIFLAYHKDIATALKLFDYKDAVTIGNHLVNNASLTA